VTTPEVDDPVQAWEDEPFVPMGPAHATVILIERLVIRLTLAVVGAVADIDTHKSLRSCCVTTLWDCPQYWLPGNRERSKATERRAGGLRSAGTR